MNIVLEGPDGGGKSTLCEYLSRNLSMEMVLGAGPPKTIPEVVARARSYLKMTNSIFDRHPLVSQPIYGALRGDGDIPELDVLASELYGGWRLPHLMHPTLHVYCRSITSARHRVKPDEDPAHIRALTDNYQNLVTAYDQWALHHAHLIYRIGDDMGLVLDFARAAKVPVR